MCACFPSVSQDHPLRHSQIPHSQHAQVAPSRPLVGPDLSQGRVLTPLGFVPAGGGGGPAPQLREPGVSRGRRAQVRQSRRHKVLPCSTCQDGESHLRAVFDNAECWWAAGTGGGSPGSGAVQEKKMAAPNSLPPGWNLLEPNKGCCKNNWVLSSKPPPGFQTHMI